MRLPSPRPAHLLLTHSHSIWPAGINASGQGTIEWAGGLINWDDPDYQAAGHFYAIVDSVSIACADTSANPADAQSYVYGANASAFSPAIDVSNETTVSGAASLRALAAGKGVWTALVAAGARTFHSLTDQSKLDERTRSPRSTGPRAGWKSTDMTGAAWPL